MDVSHPARQSRQAYGWLWAILLGTAIALATLPATVNALLLPFSIPGAICALAVGSIRADEAKKRSRMERGEGVIARWHLNAREWQECAQRNRGVHVLPSIPAERFAPPAPGIEVIFSEDAVYLDGHYYTMNRHWGTMATLAPESIELAQNGLESYSPLWIPIPPDQTATAQNVARYFNEPIA